MVLWNYAIFRHGTVQFGRCITNYTASHLRGLQTLQHSLVISSNLYLIQSKESEVQPRTSHKGPDGEYRYSSTLDFNIDARRS